MAYPVHGAPKEQVFDSMPKVFNPKTHRMEYAFFADRSPKFLNALARFLEKETFSTGSRIIVEGEVGFSMYFIYSGSVDVLVNQETTKVATLRRGACFGEMALFGCARRSATVVAAERTDLLVVKRRVFSALLRKFPDEKLYFAQIAKQRMAELEAKKRKSFAVDDTELPPDSSSDDDEDIDLPPLVPTHGASFAVYGDDLQKSPVDVVLFQNRDERVHSPTNMLSSRAGIGATVESISRPPSSSASKVEGPSRPPSSSASAPVKLSPIETTSSRKPKNMPRRASLPNPSSSQRPVSASVPIPPSSPRPVSARDSRRASASGLVSAPHESSERRPSLGLKQVRKLTLTPVGKMDISDISTMDAGFFRRHTD